MLANFLNKSKPINFIGLLVFFFLNYFVFFLVKEDQISINLSFFYAEISKILLLLVVFFFLNFIIGKNDLTYDNSYGFFVFIFLSVCLLPMLTDLNTISILTLQILFFRKVYSLQSVKQILQKLFDAGFWLGILFLFDTNAIFYTGLLFFSLIIHQKITLQTLFAPIIGAFSPLFMYFSYLYWFDRQDELFSLFQLSIQENKTLLVNEKMHLFFLVLASITSLCIVLKSVQVLPVSNTFRRSWLVILGHFSMAVILIFFSTNTNANPLLHFLFPVAVILANGIELLKKNILKEILIYGLIVISVSYLYFL